MNKQELIKKYEMKGEQFKEFPVVAIGDVLKNLRELDEPGKVKIPSVVARWIGYAKGWNKGLHYALSNASDEVLEWLCVDKLKRQEIFARAWLVGYEVEKEKKYKITLLNRNDGDLYLINQNAGVSDKYGHFSPVVLLFTKGTNFSEQCYKLTKKEVVSYDFGWVFDCPGIKIEEVE